MRRTTNDKYIKISVDSSGSGHGSKVIVTLAEREKVMECRLSRREARWLILVLQEELERASREVNV